MGNDEPDNYKRTVVVKTVRDPKPFLERFVLDPVKGMVGGDKDDQRKKQRALA